MEIHQLRYLDLVAREGSFTRAAELARVSQSGLSAQIAKLERELGHRLLDRGRHGARPTTEGELLLHQVRVVLQELDKVSETAQSLSGLESGQVRVGTVVGCDLPWFRDGLASFRREHPGISLTLKEGSSTTMISEARHGELDIALVGWAGSTPVGPEADDLSVDVITRDELVAVLRPGSRKPTRRMPIRRLTSDTLLSMPPGTGIRAGLDQAAVSAGVTLAPQLEVHSASMLLDLVTAGVGTGVVSSTMAAGVEAPVVPLATDVQVCLGIVHRAISSRAVSQFRSNLLDALAQSRD